MTKIFSISVSILLLIAFLPFNAECGGVSPEKKGVQDFLDRQIAAFDTRDITALMDMLATDPSVIMLGNGPNDRWVGPEAIKKVYKKQLSLYESEKITLDGTSIGVQDKIAWFSTQAKILKRTKKHGQSKLRINWSGVLRKQDGKWRLIQSHFSLPIGK